MCGAFLAAGRLLGVGSYGRVYHGRWHGREVAVKVIHCLPEELQRVLREAEIMLQLDHPNVSQEHAQGPDPAAKQ